MATSGTTDFNLDTEELIQESFERIGKQIRTGYDLKSAKRSLNLLLSEWANRGVHIWKVKNYTQNLVANTTVYTAPADTSDVLEAVFRNGTTDTTLNRISRSEYEALPNKSSTGTPSQYFVQRNLSNVTISLYQTPGTTDTQINYNYIARIEDAGSYTNTPDAPWRFLPALTSGLSFMLAQKFMPQRTQEMKMYYEDDLQRALTEDGQRTSVHLVPQNYFVAG